MLSKKFLQNVEQNRLNKIVNQMLEKSEGMEITELKKSDINNEIDKTLSVMYYNFTKKLISKPGISLCIPSKFLDRLQKLIELVRGYNQNDVSEFLTFFLSQLDSEMKITSAITHNMLIKKEHIEKYHKYRLLLGDVKKYSYEKNPEEYVRCTRMIVDFKKKYPPSLIYIFDFSYYWENFCAGMSNKEPNYSPITEIFSYNTYIENTCSICNNYSVTFDIHNVMDIPIPQQSSPVDIQDLIKNEYFDKIEELCEKNDSQYTCNICRIKTDAIRKIRIWDLPERLIIQLKLFDHYYDKESKQSVSKKIYTPVNYPMILDLTKYVSDMNPIKNDYRYRLCSYIKHYGACNGGHYVAVAKNWDNEYYFYNDSEPPVHIEKNSVIDDTPYILLYERIATSSNHEAN